jgi:hypothetical protein
MNSTRISPLFCVCSVLKLFAYVVSGAGILKFVDSLCGELWAPVK